MSSSKWSFGDLVTHADRPEWGQGQITSIQPIVIEGRPSQRLTIRFERAGVKKLAAAVANIQPAGKSAPIPKAQSAPLEPVGDADLIEQMAKMPNNAVDPFISIEKRLAFTLGLYRFSDQSGSLLDWAAMQTGLADPLSRFLRHDLESNFAKFRRALDRHAGDLASQLMREDRTAVKRVSEKAPEEGQRALRRLLARR